MTTIPELALLLEDAACLGLTIARTPGSLYLHAIVDSPRPNHKIGITARTYEEALQQLVDHLRGLKT